MGINETLAGREKTHGSFVDNAAMAQTLKCDIRSATKWDSLSFAKQEALEMICHKMARILSGNASEPDHWHDIAGYATLAERECLPPAY